MFKKIVSIFLCVLIVMGVLAAGGFTLQQFAERIELKNPIQVLSPLARKLGINMDLNVDPGNGGSVLVDAEDKHEDSTTPQPSNPVDDPSTTPVTEPITDPHEESSEPVDEPTTPVEEVFTKEQFNELLSHIMVADDRNLNTDYDRTVFENPVKSYELDGKKYNRNDYAWKTSPYLISEEPFKYECPYTGLIVTSDSTLDYDHIIPLKYVYERVSWDKDKCNEYAYAQGVGVDVKNSANRSKGAKGPADWLPNVNIENYCYTWLVIAEEWDIPLSQRDIDICKLYCLNAINSGLTLERID